MESRSGSVSTPAQSQMIPAGRVVSTRSPSCVAAVHRPGRPVLESWDGEPFFPFTVRLNLHTLRGDPRPSPSVCSELEPGPDLHVRSGDGHRQSSARVHLAGDPT